MKLFGSKRGGARLAKNRPSASYDSTAYHRSGGAAVRTAAPAGKTKNPLKVLAIILAIILVCELAYFFVIFTDNGFISKWRSIYIETAMDTLSHKWLATAIIPSDVIAKVMDARTLAHTAQEGQESGWGNQSTDSVIDETTGEMVAPEQIEVNVTVIQPEDPEEVAEAAFYELFHEVDKASMESYLSNHPEALENGWANLIINEAGLDDDGTEIETIFGEQVLAVDVPNKILLIRITGDGYQGILAVAKDPAMLSLRPSSKIWVAGETVGYIAENNNGVLAMTGSAFHDPDGSGNGGELSGYAMYNGRGDGYGHMGAGRKRIELHEDNLFYIKDASSKTGEGTTDAVEFGPALLIDGQIVVDANCGYTGLQPRAIIGQSDKYEILMLIIEGRQPLRSMGTDVVECAEILKLHNCMQAMNLDGGTSAMLWYDGESIISCSNAALPDGRPMPTAWVYERSN